MKLSRNNLSSFISHLSPRKGFTLVELLIVIAILGILAAGIVVVINPMEKINSANLAKAKTFAAGVENSLVMSQVGKWSFDDERDPGKDTSGNGNDGTLYGSTRQTPAECGLDLGGCLKFDGVNDYMEAGRDAASLAITSAFTFEAWIYPTYSDFNSCNTTISCAIWGSGTSGGGDVIAIIDGGKLWFYTYHATTGWLNGGNIRSVGHVSSGVWTHVAFTWDGQRKEKKIYINGKLDRITDPDTEKADGNMRGLTPIWIGAKQGSNGGYFNGLMDEVKIYNKALLSYQIQQLYARGLVKHLLALK